MNILVNEQGCAVITDFGSARRVRLEDDEADVTSSSIKSPAKVTATSTCETLTGVGWTTRWASPEVLNGQRPNLPSDIWSFGWVISEVLAIFKE